MSEMAEVKVLIVPGEYGGHCVIVTANDKIIHQTIDYPDRDFAELHAKELSKRTNEILLQSQLKD